MILSHRLQTVSRIVWAAVSLSLLSVASTAYAQSGLEAGLRLGYGIPMGKVADDAGDLSDGVSGQIPIWVDLGYRVLDELMLGLYFQYGFGLIGDEFDACDIDSVSCSASNIRLGIQAHYHIRPREQLDPWIGLGIGYEWMSVSAEGMGAEISNSMSGFELLSLQAGLDIAVTEQFKIGPFLSFSLGQYSTASAECTGGLACQSGVAYDGDIEDQALHEWLLIGVRGAFVSR